MKKHLTSTLFIFFIVLFGANAQNENVSYLYDNGQIIVTFTPTKNDKTLDSLLNVIGSSTLITDSLAQIKGKKVTSLGWELVSYDPHRIIYQKSIQNLSSKAKLDFVLENKLNMNPAESLKASAGVNAFKKVGISIIREDDETYLFKLFNHTNATQVYLSGSFNNWSTILTPMQKSGKEWVTRVKLKAGKHLYKFIVDGEWMIDPANAVTEFDHQATALNSVFYGYNYTFDLKAFSEAKNVILAGSFNGWNERAYQMQKTETGWELPMYLEDIGVHSYKFIVDGEWKLDPNNPTVRADGKGNKNSLLSMGKKYVLETSALQNARQVILTGNFNNWDETQIPMEREAGVWRTAVPLKPGNYEYKFIVDGAWRADPQNPHTNGHKNLQNSVLSVKPNYTFRLKGHKKAKKVLVSGSFNGWSTNGYSMKQEGDSWVIDVYIPKGKTLYKFVVNGRWIIDPENPYWEDNETGSKNSVLWNDIN